MDIRREGKRGLKDVNANFIGVALCNAKNVTERSKSAPANSFTAREEYYLWYSSPLYRSKLLSRINQTKKPLVLPLDCHKIISVNAILKIICPTQNVNH